MKQLIFICAAVTGLLTGMPVFAEDSAESAAGTMYVYPDAYALYLSWDGKYPEGVTGVWSETGSTEHLVFGISAADAEKIKEYILAQVEKKESVAFVEMSDSSELDHAIYGNPDAVSSVDPDMQEEVPMAAEPITSEPAVTEAPRLDIGGEAETVAWTIEETAGDLPTAEEAEEEMLDAGGAHDLPAGISPGLGSVGMESEEPHHRPLLPVLAAGIALLGGCAALLLHRRNSGKVLQNSAGGTQTAASAHPDIPALMKQTAALPPDDLRERVTALSSADQSKRKR